MKEHNLLTKRKAINNRPLLLDGAIGTYLHSLGYEQDINLWYSFLNISNPETIIEIHKEYIDAGADIITTNTFRTNPVAKKRSNLEITNSFLVKESVKLALTAKGEKEIIIAGSNAPAEDCYQKERTISNFDLDYNHKKHIELLLESGCDIIWNETHSHLDEIEIICKFCSTNSIPFSMNIYFDESMQILSGQKVKDVVELIEAYSTQSIGFNCIKKDHLDRYIDEYSTPKRFGFYLNTAKSSVTDNIISCEESPDNYFNSVKKYLGKDILFIGSCCGSSPAHTKVLREHVDEIN